MNQSPYIRAYEAGIKLAQLEFRSKVAVPEPEVQPELVQPDPGVTATDLEEQMKETWESDMSDWDKQQKMEHLHGMYETLNERQDTGTEQDHTYDLQPPIPKEESVPIPVVYPDQQVAVEEPGEESAPRQQTLDQLKTKLKGIQRQVATDMRGYNVTNQTRAMRDEADKLQAQIANVEYGRNMPAPAPAQAPRAQSPSEDDLLKQVDDEHEAQLTGPKIQARMDGLYDNYQNTDSYTQDEFDERMSHLESLMGNLPQQPQPQAQPQDQDPITHPLTEQEKQEPTYFTARGGYGTWAKDLRQGLDNSIAEATELDDGGKIDRLNEIRGLISGRNLSKAYGNRAFQAGDQLNMRDMIERLTNIKGARDVQVPYAAAPVSVMRGGQQHNVTRGLRTPTPTPTPTPAPTPAPSQVAQAPKGEDYDFSGLEGESNAHLWNPTNPMVPNSPMPGSNVKPPSAFNQQFGYNKNTGVTQNANSRARALNKTSPLRGMTPGSQSGSLRSMTPAKQNQPNLIAQNKRTPDLTPIRR